MIRFHKNGMMMLMDKEGNYHVFESIETLQNIADYIYNEPLMEDLRVNENDKVEDFNKIIYVEPINKNTQRLRDHSDMLDDTYYTEG